MTKKCEAILNTEYKESYYDAQIFCRNCGNVTMVSIKKGVTIKQALKETPIQCPYCEAMRLEG